MVRGREGELTLVIMPRLVTDILEEKLFSSRTPIVFSSATLICSGKTFTYLADGLGIQDFLSFSVESPFDYDEVMEVFAHDLDAEGKSKKGIELIEDGEQTLILFKSEYSMKQFKEQVPADWQDSNCI